MRMFKFVTDYTPKWAEELAWGCLVTFIVFFGQAFAGGEGVDDKATYFESALAGSARAAVAFAVVGLKKRFFGGDDAA